MMQDRAQKDAALRYVVARRWLPQLELDVSTIVAVGRTTTNITDVDVFASVPDEFAGFRSVAIDCKTRRNESPITRALWQRGLLDRLGAERGICVLRTARIEPDHRHTAAQLGITLVTEAEFPAFAAAMGQSPGVALGAVAEIDRWDAYFAIAKRFVPLEPAVKFSRSGYWMSETEAEACTRTIALAGHLRREWDPARAEHLAVVADLAALLQHALARVVIKLFASYLQPAEQATLSDALLYFMYGGRGAYDHLNRMRRMLVDARAARSGAMAADNGPDRLVGTVPGSSAGERNVSDGSATVREVAGRRRTASQGVTGNNLSLPEWPRFVELVRQMLDAPRAAAHAPLLTREIAFAALDAGTGQGDGVTQFARTLAGESPQGARLAVLTVDYLCRAARLPREFGQVLCGRLLAAQLRT